MKKTAVISPCGKYRYKLTRSWDATLKHLIFVMLNPSTADADKDDPTIKRLINFTKEWGYGGFHVVNLFAYRAPKPDDMFRACKDGCDIVGPQNDAYLKMAFEQGSPVVYAWGGNGHVLDRATIVAGMNPGTAFCIETSGHGFPKHPLYLKSVSQLQLVRLDPKTHKFIIPDKEHNRPQPAQLVGTKDGMSVKLIEA